MVARTFSQRTLLWLLAAVLVVPFNTSGLLKAVAATTPLTHEKPIATVIGELPELRTQYSSTLLKSDGSKQRTITQDPVNYQVTKDGKTSWEKIDDSLVDGASKGLPDTYINAANAFSAVFSKKSSQAGVHIQEGVYSLAAMLLNSGDSALATTHGNTITYNEVAPHTNLTYFAQPGGVKEQITLTAPSSTGEYVFDLGLTGVYPEKQSDGSYQFKDNETKKAVFTVPPFIMWDAKGGENSEANVYSNDIHTTLEPTARGYRLTVTPSSSWLSDAARVYPVVIDPTITVSIQYGVDTYIQEGYPDYNMWVNRDMYVGVGATKLRTRAFLPFSFEDLSYARILDAHLKVYQFNCQGVCATSSVYADLSKGYDPYGVTWNNQPAILGYVGKAASDTNGGWLDFSVTSGLNEWFNNGNASGSKVGSFECVQDNETDWGYRQWVAENNPDSWAQDKKPQLVINYNDYDAHYDSIPPIHTIVGAGDFTIPVTISNVGRNTWTTDRFYLSYHLYDSNGNLISWDNVRSPLPYAMGPLTQASFDAKVYAPENPGTYTMRWDMVQEGTTWFSDQGVSMAERSFQVDDYPEYAAEYTVPTVPASVIAGSTISLPMGVLNDSRQDWDSQFKVSYHWVDAAGKTYVKNGQQTIFSTTVTKRRGQANVNLQVKAPANIGTYTLKIDMLKQGVGWFSEHGVATKDFPIIVAAPAFSALNHIGQETFYTHVGQVDSATGNLSFTTVDVSEPSTTGLLSFSRSYSATNLDTDYASDSNGFITHWLLSGPYNEPDQSKRLTTDYLNGETTIQPSRGITSGTGVWTAINSATPEVNINQQLNDMGSVESGYGENAVTYAYTYVYAPAARKVQLKVGSDDGIRIWVNGQLVEDNDIYRGYTQDSDTVPVNFLQGWNRLLVKVSQGGGGWLFSARFMDMKGNPLTHLQYALDNPEVFRSTGILGKGWTTGVEDTLYTTDPNTIYYRNVTGAVDVFSRQADGSYAPQTILGLHLALNPDGTYTITTKAGLSSLFNAYGLLISRIDIGGNKISYTRDITNHVMAITDKNRTLRLGYHGTALYSVTDDLNHTYFYDITAVTPYQLSTVTDPLGNAYLYAYNSAHQVVAFTDKEGHKTRVSYATGSNKIATLTDAKGAVTLFDYASNQVTVTDPLKHTNTAQFDHDNVMVSATNAKGNRSFYQYDGNLNLLSIVPDLPENNDYFYRYSYTYDSHNNLLTQTDPLGNVTTYTYNSTDDLLTQTDPNKGVTTNTYIDGGRHLLSTTTDKLSHVTTYTYDGRNRRASVKDSQGAISKFTYTPDNDLATVSTAKKEITTYTYDVAGRKVSEKSPLGNVLKYIYDDDNRLLSTTNPEGLVTAFEYDKNGLKTKQINPAGKFQLFTYDVIGLLTKMTDETGATTGYQYDALGNKVKMTDAKGKITQFVYDELGQLTSSTDPSGATTTITYDDRGNPIKTVTPTHAVKTQTLDKKGQATSIATPETTATLSYDANGNLTHTTSSLNNQVNTLSYDANNNIKQVDSSLKGTSSLDYDSNNNQVTTTIPVGTVKTKYDLNQEVTSISTTLKEDGKVITNTLVKDADSRLIQVKKSNGDAALITYDGSGRVSTFTNSYKQGYPSDVTSYTYDAASNILTANSTIAGNQAYTYDDRGELLTETKDNNTTTYTYDRAGNRSTVTTANGLTRYAYEGEGDANRLLKVTNPDKTNTAYTYDASGNVIEKTDASGKTVYTYDSSNYLTKAVLPNSSSVEYAYDSLTKLQSKRTETSAAGVISVLTFTYDGEKLVSETDANGKIVRSYTWDPDESLISVTMPNKTGALQTYYYIKNAKGDIIGLTTAAGVRVATYSYDAWGNVLTSTSSATGNVPPAINTLNPRLYAGYWYDAPLGLYFMKARMYDPSIGRFLSKDTQVADDSPLSINPYLYTANNPVNNIDPDGKGFFSALNNAYNWVADHQAQIIQVAVTIAVATVVAAAIVATCGVAGIAIGVIGGIAISAVSMAVGSAVGYAVANRGHATASGALRAAGEGFVGGLVGGAAGAIGGTIVKAILPKTISVVAASTSLESNAVEEAWMGGKAAFQSHAADHAGTLSPVEYLQKAINSIENADEMGIQYVEPRDQYRYIFRKGSTITSADIETGQIYTSFDKSATATKSAEDYFAERTGIK
jgi:RHS repeat-associated protein